MKRISVAAAVCAALFVSSVTTASAADGPREPYGIDLEGFAYPYPINLFPVVNDGDQLRMAYMDVGASGQLRRVGKAKRAHQFK